MQAVQQNRGYFGRFHRDPALVSFLASAGQILAAVAIAGVVTFALVANAPTTEADSVSMDEPRQDLAKEWVWKKAPARFDHMWRVPY